MYSSVRVTYSYQIIDLHSTYYILYKLQLVLWHKQLVIKDTKHGFHALTYETKLPTQFRFLKFEKVGKHDIL